MWNMLTFTSWEFVSQCSLLSNTSLQHLKVFPKYSVVELTYQTGFDRSIYMRQTSEVEEELEELCPYYHEFHSVFVGRTMTADRRDCSCGLKLSQVQNTRSQQSSSVILYYQYFQCGFQFFVFSFPF